MEKKRGRLSAVVLGILGVVILVIFIGIFMKNQSSEMEKTYKLNDEEKQELVNKIDEIKMDSYSVCKAFFKKDIKYCNNEENVEDKEDCLFYLGILLGNKEKDETYCDNIASEDVKKYCKDYVNGNLDCSTIEGDNGLYCSALNKKDTSYCENIQSSTAKEYCKEEIGLLIAIIENDKSKCHQFSNEWVKDYCNAWLNEDKSACLRDEMKEDREEAIKKLAVEKKNKEICYAINKTKESELCLLEFAYYEDICEEIYTKDIKNACISIITKDVEMCNNVIDESAKIICNANIAE